MVIKIRAVPCVLPFFILKLFLLNAIFYSMNRILNEGGGKKWTEIIIEL